MTLLLFVHNSQTTDRNPQRLRVFNITYYSPYNIIVFEVMYNK